MNGPLVNLADDLCRDGKPSFQWAVEHAPDGDVGAAIARLWAGAEAWEKYNFAWETTRISAPNGRNRAIWSTAYALLCLHRVENHPEDPAALAMGPCCTSTFLSAYHVPPEIPMP